VGGQTMWIRILVQFKHFLMPFCHFNTYIHFNTIVVFSLYLAIIKDKKFKQKKKKKILLILIKVEKDKGGGAGNVDKIIP
jgi:hypothetical protein